MRVIICTSVGVERRGGERERGEGAGGKRGREGGRKREGGGGGREGGREGGRGGGRGGGRKGERKGGKEGEIIETSFIATRALSRLVYNTYVNGVAHI